MPVTLGETVEINFALAPQVVQLQELTVSAEPAPDVTQSESATRLSVEAVEGLPNNGRNIFNFTTLTPNVATVQGPDGDEISIGGQRGIHNNVSVDGADFNNPFFGEQRGGQRPAFTFNLDAVQDFVVVSDGANAEFGRSGGGFVNIITKSGTNEFHGSAHYFGKYDALSADPSHTFPGGAISGFAPDFAQHQFGATFGGPIVRDKAFFFLAYDQQEYNETKQTTGSGRSIPRCSRFVTPRSVAHSQGDFGPISRTNDANAFLAKLDFRLGAKHNATLKYNYTNSRQENGTFDVDFWGRSANALERDFSHAVNGSLTSLSSPRRSPTSSGSSGPGRSGRALTRGRSTRRPAVPSPIPTWGSSGPDGLQRLSGRHAVLHSGRRATTTGSRCWTMCPWSAATTSSSSAGSGTAPG